MAIEDEFHPALPFQEFVGIIGSFKGGKVEFNALDILLMPFSSWPIISSNRPSWTPWRAAGVAIIKYIHRVSLMPRGTCVLGSV